MKQKRVLLHLSDKSLVPVEPDEVFLLEAMDADTEVRLRSRRVLRDRRLLKDLVDRFPSDQIVQVHRSYAVNVDRVAEIRRRGKRDWELKLEPPVNRVIPISRSRMSALLAAYGERDKKR